VYEPYTADHVLSALQLLLGTGVAFVLLRHKLGGEPTVSVDADWFYRRPIPHLVAAVCGASLAFGARIETQRAAFARRLGALVAGPATEAWFAPRPVGGTVLWVVAALGLLALAAA
jgi:multicomponent Na+:H+ antiporter subunit D